MGISDLTETCDANFGDAAVNGCVEPCSVAHWITVQLVRLPDQKSRKRWWPKEQSGRPYSREFFNAQLPNGPQNGSLDEYGCVHYGSIPAGQAQFNFVKFYNEIKEYFDQEIRDPKPVPLPEHETWHSIM
jgi:hypothetical protein